MRRLLALSMFLVTASAPAAVAQEAGGAWWMDVSGAVVGSPGLGSPKALGFGGAIALLRERPGQADRSLGIVGHVDWLWAPPGDGRTELWLLAGPRLAARSDEGVLFLQVLVGARRVGGSEAATAGVSGTRAALGVGAGLNVLGILMPEVNLLVTPGDAAARYRLTFGAGFQLPRRLGRRGGDVPARGQQRPSLQ